jgi:16S rRNA (guanine527-N7)-methyltransferase
MIVDIGSGAGLPGVVLAIALPSARITCVERTRKRAAFIKLASHELQLANLSVEWADAVDLCLDEKYACSADIVTIRAVAGTGDALSLAAGFLKKTGSALLWQSADQMAREAVPASFSATWFQTVSATGSERGIRVCRLASAI